MSEDKDSALNAPDTSESPNSEISAQSGQQNSASQQAINPVSILDNPEFQEGLRRLLQSEKDRSVNQNRKELGEVKNKVDRLVELVESGLKPKEAKLQIENEERQAKIDQFFEKVSLQEKQQGKLLDVSGEIQGIMKAMSVDQTDPGVQDFLAKNAGEDAADKFLEYVKQRKSDEPNLSVGSVQTPAASTPPNPDLESAYYKELNKNRGDVTAITRIKQKYRKLGLQI